MAINSDPTSTSHTLGQWIGDLYNRVFVQPNDELAANACNELIAETFTARINHDHFSRDDFWEAIKKFRALNVTTIQSWRDIQSWDAPDGAGAGCVSRMMLFSDTNKESGVVTESSTLLIANVQVIDGRKMLVELTEVLKVSK